jgi:hypothetical protein
MKFLGVSGVFDYAGLSRCSRYRACSCCLPHITRASASGLTVYGAEYPPRLSSVYASLSTSRYPAQDSRPSGSLLLSRKELSSSASCRFIPAHCKRLLTTVMLTNLRRHAKKSRPEIGRRILFSALRQLLTFSPECLESPHIATVRLAFSPTCRSSAREHQKAYPRGRSPCL